MIINFNDALDSLALWFKENSKAAKALPTKANAHYYSGAAFVSKYSKQWTNEMLFAYLLVAGGAQGSGFDCDQPAVAATPDQRLWLNGGSDAERRHESTWGEHDFAKTMKEMESSAVPYMEIRYDASNPNNVVYVSVAYTKTQRYVKHGVMSTGVEEKAGHRSKPLKQLHWKCLNEECSYYRRSAGSIGDRLSKFLESRFAKLYRISLKAKPKKEKPTVVSKAIAFHNDQIKLLAVADEFAAKLRAFQRDVEAGNLNKQVVNELYSQFEDLQRTTTETKKKYKRFVGETAEETRKLAENGLTSTK